MNTYLLSRTKYLLFESHHQHLYRIILGALCVCISTIYVYVCAWVHGYVCLYAHAYVCACVWHIFSIHDQNKKEANHLGSGQERIAMNLFFNNSKKINLKKRSDRWQRQMGERESKLERQHKGTGRMAKAPSFFCNEDQKCLEQWYTSVL